MRAVVFDIGGVLLDWDPRYLYRSLIADPAEIERFLAEVCTGAFNAELDAGRPFDDACAELSARHPDHVELIRAWSRQDEMIGGEIAGTAALVERLAESGVELYLLTNMPTDVFAARRARYPVLQRFAGALVSGAEGVLKPEAEIYRRTIDRFGLTPTETLFVDDKPGNVEAAEALGLVGHQFVDAPTLEDALRDLGFLR